MTRTILCYGDSNTYGFDPRNEGRYPSSVRWTHQLQKMLGPDYKVVNAGLNSRTTDVNDPFQPGKNGLLHLPHTMMKNMPVDLLILMLGSNDLKFFFHRDAERIAEGAGRLIEKAQKIFDAHDTNGQILLISPLLVGVNISTSLFRIEFGKNRSLVLSAQLAPYFEKQARLHDVHFMDAAPITEVSDIDSLHLTIDGHHKMADAIYKKVKEIFPDEVTNDEAI